MAADNASHGLHAAPDLYYLFVASVIFIAHTKHDTLNLEP